MTYTPSPHAQQIWDVSLLRRQDCSRLHNKSFTGSVYAFVWVPWSWKQNL